VSTTGTVRGFNTGALDEYWVMSDDGGRIVRLHYSYYRGNPGSPRVSRLEAFDGHPATIVGLFRVTQDEGPAIEVDSVSAVVQP
jgi:hypothetical protein